MKNYSIYLGLLLMSTFISMGAVAVSIIPPFDNSVSVSSSVSNMQQVALESSLRSSLIGGETDPAQVKYSLSISGINGSETGGAIGSAKTRFTVTSLEGRDTPRNSSSEREWKDSTDVTGTIVTFRKNFDYNSGIRL